MVVDKNNKVNMELKIVKTRPSFKRFVNIILRRLLPGVRVMSSDERGWWGGSGTLTSPLHPSS